MTALLGIDCSTDPKKTGLALGELKNGLVNIIRCDIASKRNPPIRVIDWLHDFEKVIIAMDAPLGWPKDHGIQLSAHKAGQAIHIKDMNKLFRRMTDVEIKKRLNKQPLDVGSNLIARTAFAALTLLDQIRQITGQPIPLAWSPNEKDQWRVIEVYPAATRIAHGAKDESGCLQGLEEMLDCSAVASIVQTSKDAADAAVCALAAADFLLGRAVAPKDKETAYIEGWIWAAQKN